MEAAITAIISGFFALLGVFLKDFLDARRERRRWAAAHPGQPIPALRSIEAAMPRTREDTANTAGGGKSPTAAPDDAPVAKARWRGLFVFLSWILVLGAIGAAAYSLYLVESIIITLPALSIVGFLFAWLATRNGSRLGLLAGLSPALVGLTSLGLINLMGWSPREATVPIAELLAAWAVVLLLLVTLSVRRSRRR